EGDQQADAPDPDRVAARCGRHPGRTSCASAQGNNGAWRLAGTEGQQPVANRRRSGATVLRDRLQECSLLVGERVHSCCRDLVEDSIEFGGLEDTVADRARRIATLSTAGVLRLTALNTGPHRHSR